MNPNYSLRLFIAAAIFILFGSIAATASEMDERIESSARNSYVFKTYLKDDNIKVSSADGIVTLTGTVPEDNHKSLAYETVANLPGVNRVDNQIQTKEADPDKYSDAWVSVRVKTALLLHRNVSGSATKVFVENGVVSLKGTAENQAQIDLATEYAKDIDGVKEVKNEMVVASVPQKPDEAMSDKIDDASITAQIKLALLSHRSTSSISTKVKTDDGVVTLSGKAKNAAEKDLVTKIVSDINGVKNVVNNMSTN